MTPQKKKPLRDAILTLIKANNGITLGEILKSLNRPKNSVLYHIKILEKEQIEARLIKKAGKRSSPLNPIFTTVKKYYIKEKTEPLKIDLVNRSELESTLQSIYTQKLSPFFDIESNYEQLKKIRENNPFYLDIIEFEQALLKSIDINYTAGFFLSNHSKHTILKHAQDLLYAFLFDDAVLHNMNSLSDLKITFTLSIGDISSQLPQLDFHQLKKTIFQMNGLIDDEKIETAYNSARNEHVIRVEREPLIRQIIEDLKNLPDSLENEIDSQRLQKLRSHDNPKLKMFRVLEFIQLLQYQYNTIECEPINRLKRRLNKMRNMYLKGEYLAVQKTEKESFEIRRRGLELFNALTLYYNKTNSIKKK